METNQKIKQQQQQIARLERKLALKKIKERKKATRDKIELGGLVIKSNMNQFSKVVILGALIDAFDNIKNDNQIEKIFRAKGESAFMGYSDIGEDR